MKHFSRLILSLALFCSARTQAQTAYTIQDLGTLGGDVTVAGLNNHGEVTADFFDNVSTYRSGLYSNGILQDITAKAGPSVGNINDAGQIAGDAYAGANFRAILYNSHTGQTQVIGPYNSAAAVVNQNGVAAGLVYTQPRQTYAALFRNGQATQLISFAGGGDPYNALAINNHDQVVGQGFDAIGECAYLSSGGVSYSLGRLPGGKSAGATGINDSGAIVGYSGSASISPGYSHPFLYQNGVIQDLGTFGGPEGGATAINNAGVVVGDADYLGVGDPTVPFVYSGGVMRNLFDMIPDGSAWNTGFAEAINDNGQIAGEAYHNGGLHIFLATPVAVPEPGAWACFGVGAVVLGGMLRRRNRVGNAVGSLSVLQNGRARYTAPCHSWFLFLLSFIRDSLPPAATRRPFPLLRAESDSDGGAGTFNLSTRRESGRQKRAPGTTRIRKEEFCNVSAK